MLISMMEESACIDGALLRIYDFLLSTNCKPDGDKSLEQNVEHLGYVA